MEPPGPSVRTRRLRSRRLRDDYVSAGFGSRVAGIAGLVLLLSPLMDWYTGTGDGITIGVIGWHTGTAGKLVFFLGLVAVLVVVLRELGIQLPASVPESLLLIAAGALATVFVLIRLISVPERFIPWNGRGVGIWIALVAAVAVILGGVIQASEDL
jgi:hypothetical protein